MPQALELEPPPEHSKKCYGYIYVITHKKSGRQYVGQTMKPVSERWLDHQKSATEERDTNRPFASAIRRYGTAAFCVEQVATTNSYHEANRLERQWIAKLNTRVPHGFNFTRGGGGLSLGRVIEVGGKRYRSIALAARAYAVPPRLITERLGRGWSIDQAFGLVPEPPSVRSRGQRVTVIADGKKLTFKSLSAAAKHFGLSTEAVRQRVAKCGWSMEEALGIVQPRSRWAWKAITINIRGSKKSFRSVSQAAAAAGMDEKLIYGRLKKGWTVDEAFGISQRQAPKPKGKACVVMVKGVRREYDSISDAAREQGLSLALVSSRVHNLGWTLEQALELVPRPLK